MVVSQQNLFMNNRALCSHAASQICHSTFDAMHTFAAESYGTAVDRSTRRHFLIFPSSYTTGGSSLFTLHALQSTLKRRTKNVEFSRRPLATHMGVLLNHGTNLDWRGKNMSGTKVASFSFVVLHYFIAQSPASSFSERVVWCVMAGRIVYWK